MRQRPSRPTDSELAILQVLWKQGRCTVRQVFEHLSESRQIGYTTVLKLMQIMADKKLVMRDESQRSHVYQAKHHQEQTQKQLLRDLIGRAFDGQANQLVMQALRVQKISSDEINEIRKMLDDLEGQEK